MNACATRFLSGFLLLVSAAAAQDRSHEVVFRQEPGRLVILVDQRAVASYVFADPQIPRPYFAHVRAPGGQQVTRNHPPIAEVDRTDHDTLHPGIWMAFGDLDGADFWRNRARVEHRRFLQAPQGGTGSGSFVEEKDYLRDNGETICREEFRCTWHAREDGYLLEWDATFRSDRDFYFGDQEEMGLGLRVTTPVSEVAGGRLLDSQGRQGARAIWSHAADWCDYSGVVDGRRLGLTLFCHPENFRASWLHARDYGFVAANAFGRKAMNQGAASRVVVRAGEELRLRYGIWIYAAAAGHERPYAEVYQDYLRGSAEPASDQER